MTNQPQNQKQGRELAPRQEQDAEIVVQPSNKIPDEILQVAATLHAMAVEGGGGISKAAAIRAAQYLRDTGDTLGRDVYLGTKGNVAGQIMDGYQGVAKRVKRDYYAKYRRPTAEEMEDHEMDPNGSALICEVYVYDLMERARRVGMPYEPIIGICYYGPRVEFRVPPTKTRRWVLEKNALKDALRHVSGVPTTLGEAMEIAEEHGVDPDLIKDLDGITPRQAMDYVDAVVRVQSAEPEEPESEPSEEGLIITKAAVKGWEKMCLILANSDPYFALDAPDKPNVDLIVKLATQALGFDTVTVRNLSEIQQALVEYHKAEREELDDDQGDLFSEDPEWK